LEGEKKKKKKKKKKKRETMLHELLVALVGYTGDLIIDEREHSNSLGIDSPISDEPTFKLAPDISFIQPSERYPKFEAQFLKLTLRIAHQSRVLLLLQGCYTENHHLRVLLQRT
jgi:hypothetical protein